MESKFPVVVTASTIQTTLFAALRILSVLIGGATAIFGFVSARDLAGLIAYVQSSEFLTVAGALAAIASFGYGLWSTYWHKNALVTVANAVPDAIAQVVPAPPISSRPSALAALPVLMLAGAFLSLAGCSTVGTVRLNTDKAFLTAQISFKSVQQATLAVCTTPPPGMSDRCNQGIALLHTGAQAEAAAFTAEQAGNSADLQTALVTLTSLPAQLVALGILKAN